jgi:hypothetical protein
MKMVDMLLTRFFLASAALIGGIGIAIAQSPTPTPNRPRWRCWRSVWVAPSLPESYTIARETADRASRPRRRWCRETSAN